MTRKLKVRIIILSSLITQLAGLIACDLPFDFLSTPTPVPTSTPRNTPRPRPQPTETPSYSAEERTELIELCQQMATYFEEEDKFVDEFNIWQEMEIWEEELWEDAVWGEMYDRAVFFRDWQNELLDAASQLSRPRPARDFHDLFNRAQMTYSRAGSMYVDYFLSHGEQFYDEYVELDQQSYDEYNQSLELWEHIAEQYEFDPYECR